SRVPHQNYRPARSWSRRKRLRNAQHRDRARTIVIRAVPDSILNRPLSHAPSRPGSPWPIYTLSDFALRIADVIVVRTKEHISVLQLRIAAFNHSYHVPRILRTDNFVVAVQLERYPHVLEREFRQFLTRSHHSLEVGVLRFCAAEKKIEELVLGSHRWRYPVVQSLYGCEVPVRNRPPKATRKSRLLLPRRRRSLGLRLSLRGSLSLRLRRRSLTRSLRLGSLTLPSPEDDRCDRSHGPTFFGCGSASGEHRSPEPSRVNSLWWR